jgi:hypothetical protein
LQINNTESTIAVDLETLEQKYEACNMLLTYVDEMKEGYAPFIDETATLCVELLKIYSTDEIRMSCASLIPSLLKSKHLAIEKSLFDSSPDDLLKLLKFFLPSLLNSIKSESNDEVLYHILVVFREVSLFLSPTK